MATIIEKERTPSISETLQSLEKSEETVLMAELEPGTKQCAVFEIGRRNTINNTIQILKLKTDLRFKTRVEKVTEDGKEVEKVYVWRIA